MLPPVILMQRLDSSLDPTLVACELPWFLQIPKDFSEKSSFYGTFLSPGVPYRAPLIGGAAGAHTVLAASQRAMPPRLA